MAPGEGEHHHHFVRLSLDVREHLNPAIYIVARIVDIFFLRRSKNELLVVKLAPPNPYSLL